MFVRVLSPFAAEDIFCIFMSLDRVVLLSLFPISELTVGATTQGK